MLCMSETIDYILENGTILPIQYPDTLTFGSLRPIKRGGKSEYYCRECFLKKKNKDASLIPLKTPHWTQSFYLDTVQESGQRTRLCYECAIEWLAKILPESFVKEYPGYTRELIAELILEKKERVKFDIATLRSLIWTELSGK